MVTLFEQRLQGKIITIRLGCIDAPETAQTPWGEQSAQRLQQLLPAGQAVKYEKLIVTATGVQLPSYIWEISQ
jgi:micrococcal nuclease